MPDLRTDDGPRSLRAVWLGPNGATLPFEWTYVQWLVTLTTGATVGFLVGLAGWLVLGDPVYATAACMLWGWPAGMWLGVRCMRGVTFDEPLRAKITTARSQLGHRGHQHAPRLAAWELACPPIQTDCAAIRMTSTALDSVRREGPDHVSA